MFAERSDESSSNRSARFELWKRPVKFEFFLSY